MTGVQTCALPISLGAQRGDLAEADFFAAVHRLDELGLIERVQAADDVR